MLVRLFGSVFKTNRHLPVLVGLVVFAGGAVPMASATTALSVVGLAASNKVYDGTTAATLNTNGTTLIGITPGDDVYLDTNSYTAAFASSDAGGQTVTVTSLGLAGTNKDNYTLTLPGGLSATITPRPLGIAAIASDKTYDHTKNAFVDLEYVNIVFGDQNGIIAGYDTAGFDSKDVGLRTVTVKGLFIVGPAANNYTFTNENQTATTTATISPKILRVAAVGIPKTYNGSTAATVTLYDNHYSGDIVTNAYDHANTVFGDKNVGTGKAIAVTGITIGGAQAGNYTLNGVTTASAQANINPATLSITAAGVNKTYDGTVNATVTLTPNPLGSDSVAVSYSSASFGDKTAGTGKAVTVSGIVITGDDSGNYTASATLATTADITARTLTVVATGVNKTYDGNSSASVSLTGNFLSGDNPTLAFTTASFTDKNIGVGRTVTVTGISLSGTGAGNYSLDNTSATTQASINQRTLHVSATGVSKVYDGTTTATVVLPLTDDRVSGDSLTATYASASFSDKNVGGPKTVSVSGLQISGADAGNYILSSPTTSTSASITGLSLTVTAVGQDKIYDGGTAATVTLADNRVAGDTFTVSYSAAFGDKAAGTGKTITVSSISISGGSSGNYTLANNSTTTTADISTRSLTAAATGNNKVYDGTTAATVNLTDNPLSGDVVTLTYNAATFADPYFGISKTITVTDISISGGAEAGNYHLSSTTATTHADITARTLTVTATGQNKSYDGTTNATATLSDDRLNSDDITVSFSSASFSDKNVGTNKTVTVHGLVITGSAAASYSLTNTTVTTTANISSRNLTVVASGVNRAYDGTTNATVTLRDVHITGDNLTLSYGSASFSDKNVGSGKTVTVTGIGVIGPDAGNYALANTNATTQASITNRFLAVSAIGVNKVYDGTLNATVTLGDDRVSGDVLTDSYTSASFADKNVGTGIYVSVTGIQVTGDDAGNYSLINTTTNTTANITGRTLTVAATGQNKTYDAGTTVTVALSDNHLAGDTVTIGYVSANFADKRVGSGKSITVAGISIGGASAGNYTLGNSAATATANITPFSLVVSATAANKVYDGTVNAAVSLQDSRMAGDIFTASYGSASFLSSSVGDNKTVNIAGIFIAGTDAGNYVLSNTTAVALADITAGIVTGSLVSSANPTGFRDAIAFTETLPLDASGTVAYYTNGVAFTSGSLNGGVFTGGTITNLPRGTNIITAVYSGDGNYSGITNNLSQVVTNHPPVTGFFSFSVTNGVALRVKISDLLTAVVDADGDAVSFVGVNTSTNGISLPTNSAYILFHNTNYVNDQFRYAVVDSYGAYSTGTVAVTSIVVPFTSEATGQISVNGGTNTVSFHGVPGFTYVVQRSGNLLSWTDVATNEATAGGNIQVTDTFSDLSGPPASAFYRLKWKP